MFLFFDEKNFLKIQLPNEMINYAFYKNVFFSNKPKLENKTKILSGKNIHGIKLSLSLKLEYKISKI